MKKPQKGAGLMKNIEMNLDGNMLTVKVDLTKEFGPSASGKTIIIASTEGNISVPGNEEIKIGLNIYKKKKHKG
jgi:NAD(P)-dependent dehydrogenase (short-subunit alcohol dehydrogenase family)